MHMCGVLGESSHHADYIDVHHRWEKLHFIERPDAVGSLPRTEDVARNLPKRFASDDAVAGLRTLLRAATPKLLDTEQERLEPTKLHWVGQGERRRSTTIG